jgi:hydroxyethylthiazole kinase-like uncharacterized protein yjeF
MSYRPPKPPDLARDAHKGDAGRVLAVCGSRDMPGAAILVARAAQRAGAGLVTLGVRTDVVRVALAASAPEAITIDLESDALFVDGRFESLLAERSDHACIAGPGLGNTPTTRRIVLALAAVFAGPLVLDADALNALGTDLECLAGRAHPTVLTPHPGEAERLLGRAIPATPTARIEAAREIARRAGAICCLKGHGTVVADLERVYVNDTGNPGMATAGAGDVLSGIAAAYLAHWQSWAHGQNRAKVRSRKAPAWSPFDAVAAAVRVHGLAGDIAAANHGSRGTVASDLIAWLPHAQTKRRLRAP